MAIVNTRRTLTENVSLTVTDIELGWAIMTAVAERCRVGDDAGCDWYTEAGVTYIAADRRWVASRDPLVATLVDAAYILMHGQPNVMPTDEEPPR